MRHHLPQKVHHSKGDSHKDTLLCTPLLWDTPRGGANRRITPGPHSQPFGGARQRWKIWVNLSTYPQPTHQQHPYFPCEASETNRNVGMGEGCRLEDIYIYIYIYIYFYMPVQNKVSEHMSNGPTCSPSTLSPPMPHGSGPPH